MLKFVFIKVCNIFILKERNKKYKKIRKSLNFRFFHVSSARVIKLEIYLLEIIKKNRSKNEPPNGTLLTTISKSSFELPP